jgi:hypothetical protein
MCWTTVPTYQRTDLGSLNSTINSQTRNNFDSSYAYEAGKNPAQSALRLGPTSVPQNITADINLGGGLRGDTQDQTVNTALNQTNGAGTINSYNGRGAVAKDIGTTAEQLRQMRLSRGQDFLRSEPLQFQGLNSGELASIWTDDKVRQFQNQKDKAQAQQADTATNIALGLGLTQVVSSFL